MSDAILGYRKDGTPIIQPHGYVYTQAFIHCSLCGKVISGHGGPSLDSLCVKCYTDVMIGAGDD